MRKLVIAALLLSSSVPALAGHRDREADAVADRLSDPAAHDAMAGMVRAITRAMLDLRVDGIARAIEPLRDPEDRYYDGPPPRTMRDIVGRDDPYLEERLADETGRAAATMGAGARAMADMVPELRRLTEQMRRSIDAAVRSYPPRY